MEKSVYRPNGKDYIHVNDDRTLKIDKKYIESLKAIARENDTGKCKMCLHNDIREHVHEMVNIFPEGSYVRPHMHPFKTETQNIVEGKMLMILFDDIGAIQDKFVMERSGIFTFRIDKGIIHTNIPLTDVVVYEVTSGPFVGKDDSVFPYWAPEAEDEEGVRKIMERMR